MLVTDNRPEYRAAIETKYINTTSKCIALFYWIWYEEKLRTSDEINADQVANLTVWTVDEDKKRHLVFTTIKVLKVKNEMFFIRLTRIHKYL